MNDHKVGDLIILRRHYIPGRERRTVAFAVYSAKVSIDVGCTLSLPSMQEKTERKTMNLAANESDLC